jgi:hypothetical protein
MGSMTYTIPGATPIESAGTRAGRVAGGQVAGVLKPTHVVHLNGAVVPAPRLGTYGGGSRPAPALAPSYAYAQHRQQGHQPHQIPGFRESSERRLPRGTHRNDASKYFLTKVTLTLTEVRKGEKLHVPALAMNGKPYVYVAGTAWKCDA